MFSFFKKKKEEVKDVNLYAPVDGKCVDISEVNDETFASKILGDGFAVIPTGDVIAAPCDGVITMVFPTGHAFCVKMDDGKEILIHIGIDTVQLNGEGFKVLKEADAAVKAGDPVVKVDKAFVESKGYELSTMVVVSENPGSEGSKQKLGEAVQCKDLIMSF